MQLRAGESLASKETKLTHEDVFRFRNPVIHSPASDRHQKRINRSGVHGVRLMGGGFGGCVVAVCEPGALDEGWHAVPGPGASVHEA